jgi:hypothetical protein
MIPDIDIFRLLLRSVPERSPLRSGFDSATLNAHCKLLLEAGLTDGVGLSRDSHLVPNGRPLVHDYTLGPLTYKGQQFVAMSSDERIWESAKRAYEAADCDWSLDQLYDYLQKSTQQSQ